MTEPHKRPNRHPKYKTAYRVKNWAEYDKALRDRGDITLWISQEAIGAWTPPQTGKRGAQPVYADVAIETALAFRLLFHLALRQTERFLGSVLTVMGLDLPWEPVYAAIEEHSLGARAIIPPRKDAVLSPTASTAPTQRDQHLLEIERTSRFAWKRMSGYYAQSHAENAFARFKRTFGCGLRAKREESQEREASLACQLLNRMRELGCPQSYPVG